MLLAAALASLPLPAHAQQILRDAETEAFMADMSAPLVHAAGMEPRNVQVMVINDPEINAFVAGGQYVWVHSGLIAQADNVNQLQGVVAHELGHIEGGHIIRSSEGIKAATSVTLLSLVLGAAAIAGGAGEAGLGIMGLGQQAALSNFLAFSRAQESSADLAGARYLAKSGISAVIRPASFSRRRVCADFFRSRMISRRIANASLSSCSRLGDWSMRARI